MSDFMSVEGVDETPEESVDKKLDTPSPKNASNVGGENRYNIVDLPSNGNLNYPSSVNYREMLFGDEKVLASAADDTYLRTLNNVLKSILNDCEFYEDLSIHDRDYLLMWIFANNYNPYRDLQIECPSCGNVDEKRVDLTKLEVTPLTDDYVEPFKFTSEKGHELALRVIRVKDELKADKHVRTQIEKQIPSNKIDDIANVMQVCSIDVGQAIELEQKLRWCEQNLTISDMRIIRRFHEYFSFGVNDVITHNCTSCDYELTGRVPFDTGDTFRTSVSDDFEDLLRSNQRAKDSAE